MSGENGGTTWRKEAAPVERHSPYEEIPGLDGLTVGDFWSWGFSDILNNSLRGTFAEFLVGAALGVTEGSVQSGWSDYDLDYAGYKIEVKCSAYVQSWYQEKPSAISFDIGRRGSWDAATNAWIPERKRSAHCYVFCLYAEMDRDKANVLDTVAWRFYVLSTPRIDEAREDKGRIGLRQVESMTGPMPYEHLKEAVHRALPKAVQGDA